MDHSDDHCNEIEEGLYLGDWISASTESILQKYNIEAILTVHKNELPLDVLVNRAHFSVKVDDQAHYNLLDYFEECYQFISSNIDQRNVLVHCQHGLSRSAAVVISYLMKKYSLSDNEARQRVETKRLIFPNSGFANQLQLYYAMGFSIKWNQEYKLYCLNQAYNFGQGGPLTHKQIQKYFGKKWQPAESPMFTFSLRCKKCRIELVPKGAVVAHRSRYSPTWNHPDNFPDSEACMKSFFCIPSEWMASQTQSYSTKINLCCPQCESKVGSYNWSNGTCPCGASVQPSYCLTSSKVDCDMPFTFPISR